MLLEQHMKDWRPRSNDEHMAQELADILFFQAALGV